MAVGKRKGAGRKPVHINGEELEKLFGLQCTDAELEAWFNVSESTFARRKKEPAIAQAMERGRARGLLSLRRNMWALGGSGREEFKKMKRVGLDRPSHL